MRGHQTPSRKILEDEYVQWLSFANAGMMDRGNLYCFDLAIRNLPTDNPIIEIGSFCGLSTNMITYCLARHNKHNKVFTSDRWIFEGAEAGRRIGHSGIDHTEYRSFVMDTFKRNVSFFSKDNLPHPIEVFSDDFFDMWSKKQQAKDLFGRDVHLGGPISFAFVDGNHTYEYAKRDFENIATFLDPGGYVFFDDSSDEAGFGSSDLMKEILVHPDFECVAKNPHYLFKKKK